MARGLLRTCVIQCALFIFLAQIIDSAQAKAKIGCAKRCPEACRPTRRHLISVCQTGATEADPWTKADIGCDAPTAESDQCPTVLESADGTVACVCISPAELEAKKKAAEEAAANPLTDSAPIVVAPEVKSEAPSTATAAGCKEGSLACKSLSLHGGSVGISHREITSIEIDVLDADGNPGAECNSVECRLRVCATTLGDGVNKDGQSLFVGFGTLPQCVSRGSFGIPCSNIDTLADSCDAVLDSLIVEQDVNGWVVTKIEDAYFPEEDEEDKKKKAEETPALADGKSKADDAKAKEASAPAPETKDAPKKNEVQPPARGKSTGRTRNTQQRAGPTARKMLSEEKKEEKTKSAATSRTGPAPAKGARSTVTTTAKFNTKHKPVKPVKSMEICRTFFMNDILTMCPGTTASVDNVGSYEITVVAETRVAGTECDKKTCPMDTTGCCTETIHSASRKIRTQINPVSTAASIDERMEKMTTFNMHTYMMYAQSVGGDMCYKFAIVTDKPTVLTNPNVQANAGPYPYHISFAGACPESMRGSEWDPALQHCSQWRVCSEADQDGVHLTVGEAGTEYCSKLAVSYDVGTGEAGAAAEEQTMTVFADIPSCFTFPAVDENGNAIRGAADAAAEAINQKDVVIDVKPVVAIKAFVGKNGDIPYNSAHQVPAGSPIYFEACMMDTANWPGLNLVLDFERVEIIANGSSVIIFPDDPVAAAQAKALEDALAQAKLEKRKLTAEELARLQPKRDPITKDDVLYVWRGFERVPNRAGSPASCMRGRFISNATDTSDYHFKVKCTITADTAESLAATVKRRRLLSDGVTETAVEAAMEQARADAAARIADMIRNPAHRKLMADDDDEDDDNHGCRWGQFCGVQTAESSHRASSTCDWGHEAVILHCQSAHHHRGHHNDSDDDDEEHTTQTLVCHDGRPPVVSCVRPSIRNHVGTWVLVASIVFVLVFCCIAYCIMNADPAFAGAFDWIHGYRTSKGPGVSAPAAGDGGAAGAAVKVDWSDE